MLSPNTLPLLFITAVVSSHVGSSPVISRHISDTPG